jgi:aminocarboxymuconate-semialdehyde decarboxylase
MKRIDADSHFMPPAELDNPGELLPGFSREAVAAIVRDAQVFSDPNARNKGFHGSAAGKQVSAGPAPKSGPVGLSVAADRVGLLPQTGFDMQVLIPHGIYANPFGSPVGQPWAPGLRRAICRAYNEASAKAQRDFPDQLIGTAIVPFAEVDESIEEATYAVCELGLKAVTINGNWRGRNYDSVELFPFWKKMSDLGAILYVHHNPFACNVIEHKPTTYTLGWERMSRLHVSNYLGFAFEYMMGMAALTLGGVLEHFPELKFCFFEAGGSFLPYTMYTLDRVYGIEPQCARCSRPPSELIRQSCFVAVEPDEFCLPQAVSAIGSENFIIGSDYPHSPSTFPNTAAGIERMEGLTAQDRDNILGANMQRLFKIS